MSDDLIKKLQKKINYNLRVVPIFKDSDNEKLLTQFIEKQNFLKPEKILSILKINYLKDYPLGYSLILNSKIVGFLGTIFSKRKINNALIEQCYLHSWIVNEDYRTQAFRLIMPILEKKIFISTYSPIKTLEGLYSKLNFDEKKYYTKIILTFPFQSKKQSKARILNDKKLFEDYLSEENKSIYRDHYKYQKNFLFVYFGSDFKDNLMLVIKKRFKKFLLPTLEIIHISDPEKFKKNEQNIKYELAKKFKTFLFIENYFENNSVFFSNQTFTKIKFKKAFYKNIPSGFKFDFLYSEVLD